MKRTLAGLLLGLLLVIPSLDAAPLRTHGTGVPLQPVVFAHVPIGGGGAVVSMSSVPSANLLLAKTDQFGCYKSVSNSQWVQLDTVAAMPNDGIAVLTSAGAPIANGSDECVGDPSNGNNIWMGVNGSIYLSTNGGTTFGTTCYPNQGTASQNPNQNSKGLSHTIAVDPNNSSVVYMATMSAGLQFTKDQGATCSLISTSSIPIAGTINGGGGGGGHLIAFDTSGGTTTVAGQTRTAIVYATSYGHGVYKSSDGGVTWAIQNSANMPTMHWAMVSDNHGNLWLADDASNQGGSAWKYNGSTTWTSLSASVSGLVIAVAVDPNSCASAGACHIVFMMGGGGGTGTCLTQNGGGTWNCATGGTQTFVTTDVPWLANWLTNFGLFPGGAAFDASGHVYTGGEGVYVMTPPTSGTAITFTSQTLGIEEALTSTVLTSPTMSGSVVVGTWDINCFTLSTPNNTLPGNSNRGCFNTNHSGLQHTYSLDWASSSPSTIFALTDNQTRGGGSYVNYSGISSNGGSTWATALAAPSSVTTNGNDGGCIAAASATNAMWLPTDGSGGAIFPLFTTNAGASATYTSITISGITTGGWTWADFLNSKQCAADRVLSNTFYVYNWQNGTGSSNSFVKCTSGGASCTNQSSFNLPNSGKFIPILKTMPGQSGTFFFSYAISTPFADDSSYGFYYSTNGGVSKTQITGWTMVAAYGFGATISGHTMPSIVAVGFFNHVWGIYESIDWDSTQTWQKIGDYPLGLPVTIADVDGDKTIPHLWYYGTNSGVFCSSIIPTSYCGNTF